jgi:hypothetical protein
MAHMVVELSGRAHRSQICNKLDKNRKRILKEDVQGRSAAHASQKEQVGMNACVHGGHSFDRTRLDVYFSEKLLMSKEANFATPWSMALHVNVPRHAEWCRTT